MLEGEEQQEEKDASITSANTSIEGRERTRTAPGAENGTVAGRGDRVVMDGDDDENLHAFAGTSSFSTREMTEGEQQQQHRVQAQYETVEDAYRAALYTMESVSFSIFIPAFFPC